MIRGNAPSGAERAVAAALLALFLLQGAASALRKSLTVDEYTHFGAAAAYLVHDHYEYNANHPPLSKLITGVAYAPLRPETPELIGEGVRHMQRVYGLRFIRANAARLGILVFLGRLPHLLLAALLGWMVWIATRRLAGPAGAFAALLLFSTDPNILAHARLVHTDSDLAVFAFGFLLSLAWWFFGPPSWTRAALTALFLSLALLTKYSAGALLLFGPLLLGAAVLGARLLRGNGEIPRLPSGSHLLRLAVSLAVLLPLLLFVAYRGDPSWYARGAASVWGHNARGHLAYLLGEWYRGGRWFFFPVTLAVKTPLPLALLAGLGAGVALRGLRHRSRAGSALFLLPFLFWVGAGMAGSINLGVRHILPGYVFLFPAAGAAAEAFAGRRGAFRILLGALLLFQVSVAARAFPDYIPYFNEAAGGPDAGGRYLADSNLDWGQNLLSLKHWMGENGVEEVLLKEATPGAPDAYGLRTLVPFRARPSTENPVHLALGETMRLRMTLGAPGGDEKAAFLDRQEIVARIGHAMRVYRVTEPFPREFFHLRGRKPEEPDEPDPTF